MAHFQTKNTNLGQFWRVLQWKTLVNFMAIWSILQPFGVFLVILYIFLVFGILYLGAKKNLATLMGSS
jgi:hypothetical protein